MEHRDRAAGWQHAKLSGHKNEELVKKLLDTDQEFQGRFLDRIGYPESVISQTNIGGLHEKNVTNINHSTTKSKTDLKVFLNSGEQINISIKKSLGGQVYFVGAGLFMQVFEAQFQKSIPNDVKRAISLFWAARTTLWNLSRNMQIDRALAPISYSLSIKASMPPHLKTTMKNYIALCSTGLLKTPTNLQSSRSPQEQPLKNENGRSLSGISTFWAKTAQTIFFASKIFATPPKPLPRAKHFSVQKTEGQPFSFHLGLCSGTSANFSFAMTTTS